LKIVEENALSAADVEEPGSLATNETKYGGQSVILVLGKA